MGPFDLGETWIAVVTAEVAMLFSWYNVAMLAVEANNVIKCRCRVISQGGARSFDEINLMCIEKQQAFSEACSALSNGASANAIVELFRTKVAANQLRLDGLFY